MAKKRESRPWDSVFGRAIYSYERSQTEEWSGEGGRKGRMKERRMKRLASSGGGMETRRKRTDGQAGGFEGNFRAVAAAR